MQAARIVAADDHGEGVVKAKRRTDGETELVFIVLLHALINLPLVAAGLLFENCGQRGACVFRIDIDSSRENRLLADEGAREIEAALHWQVGSSFYDLREYFSENDLLGKVLGPTTMRLLGRTQPGSGR